MLQITLKEVEEQVPNNKQNKKNMNKTPSYTSPKNSSRACLCKDTDTYSIKCCDGSLWAQGIGNIYRKS